MNFMIFYIGGLLFNPIRIPNLKLHTTKDSRKIFEEDSRRR